MLMKALAPQAQRMAEARRAARAHARRQRRAGRRRADRFLRRAGAFPAGSGIAGRSGATHARRVDPRCRARQARRLRITTPYWDYLASALPKAASGSRLRGNWSWSGRRHVEPQAPGHDRRRDRFQGDARTGESPATPRGPGACAPRRWC
ncbi:hypothetical protein ACU4GD_13345 [Cupriavidus basilensis]